MTRLLTFSCAVVAASLWADVRSFDLYQPIVDRQPFGQPPPNFDPTVSPTARNGGGAAGAADVAEIPLSQQQEQLQKTVNATVIYIEPITRTPWLGFADTTDPKAPRNHLVALGGREDGWLVKEIDAEKKTAVLAKDDVEIDVVVGARQEKTADEKGGNAPKTKVGVNAFAAGSGAPRSGLLNNPHIGRPAPVPRAPSSDAAEPQSDATAPRSFKSLRQERLDRERQEKARMVATEERLKAEKARADENERRKHELEAENADAKQIMAEFSKSPVFDKIQQEKNQDSGNEDGGEGE